MASCIIPSKFIPYCSPAILADGDNFAIKIAETPAELEAAQRLRYDIFKSEQGRMGHMTQAVEGVDSDEYDQYCIHLVVLDIPSLVVVEEHQMTDKQLVEELVKVHLLVVEECN